MFKQNPFIEFLDNVFSVIIFILILVYAVCLPMFLVEFSQIRKSHLSIIRELKRDCNFTVLEDDEKEKLEVNKRKMRR